MSKQNHSPDIAELERRIGYSFADKELIYRALTHPSYANESRADGMKNNERLEFLGDSVLGLIIADMLFHHSNAREGELTRAKNNFVNSYSLMQKSKAIGLGEFLLLGRGEELSEGRTRPSILENTFEALLGAIYLDGGLEDAKVFVNKHFANDFKGYSTEQTTRIEYKGTLQEKVQLLHGVTPQYRIVKETGPAHDREFTAEVLINGEVKATGIGSSKKSAEQEAARQALSELN